MNLLNLIKQQRNNYWYSTKTSRKDLANQMQVSEITISRMINKLVILGSLTKTSIRGEYIIKI